MSSDRPRALDAAREAVQQLARPRLDERAAGLDLRGVDERVDGGRAEPPLELVLELLAQLALDVGPQLVERVELAHLARELVVERRQDLLVDLLQRHSTVLVSFSETGISTDAVAPALMPTSVVSSSGASLPPPSSTP